MEASGLAQWPEEAPSLEAAPWAEGSISLVTRQPPQGASGTTRCEGLVTLDRASPYGCPFVAEGLDGGERTAAAYRRWLTGSCSASVAAAAYRVRVTQWQLGKYPLEVRLRALLRLVARVRQGERICLCCPCGYTQTPGACHGDVIE